MGRGLDGYLLPLALCGFQAPPGVASRKIPVAHSEWETPLPIPNRAVKPLCADGTWGATSWESRSPPVLLVAVRTPRGRRTAALGRMAGAAATRPEQTRFLQQGAVAAAGLGPRRGALAGRSGRKVCATLASAPNGLQPVLAKGCEVDQKVGGVGQPVGDVGL